MSNMVPIRIKLKDGPFAGLERNVVAGDQFGYFPDWDTLTSDVEHLYRAHPRELEWYYSGTHELLKCRNDQIFMELIAEYEIT